METQPQLEDAARFDVDGVTFEMDLSGLDPMGRRLHRANAASGRLVEPVMTRCLTRLLRRVERPRLLDVGGLGGYYPLYAAALLGNGSEPVDHVEGNPAYAPAIRRSAELNGLRNLRVHEAALSEVELDRLHQAGTIPAPSVVRMDAHGSEGKLLFGMRSLLGSVDYLLMELHNHAWLEERSPGIGRADILRLFRELGLSVYFVAGNRAGNEPRARRSIDAGRFAYRRVTPENAGCLFVDRLSEVLLLVTPRDDVPAVLGESVDDPLLVY